VALLGIVQSVAKSMNLNSNRAGNVVHQGPLQSRSNPPLNPDHAFLVSNSFFLFVFFGSARRLSADWSVGFFR
jgi:hypothetical protein